MYKKKICLIAQFPPPIHGLSKAVDTLYNSNLAEEFELEKVDLRNNRKFLNNLRVISRSKADLFYFTISQTKGGNLRDLIIFKLLELQHKKCLIHLHGGYYRKLVDNDMSTWQSKINYKSVNKIDGAIVLGPSLKSIYQGMLLDEKIFIVPNCVDDEFLMSNEEFEGKLEILINKKVLHVLYLSNFIKTKGYPEVLELARLEKERISAGEKKRFHFDFAGKFFRDEDKCFFEGFIREHKLEDIVTYHGIVGGNEKKALLKKSDVFILLTRYPNEGQPISLLEAMVNGMLIITTDHAGIPDLVQDGFNGIVSNSDDVSVYKIMKFLMNIENSDFLKYIKNGRATALNDYSERQYIDNIRKLFKII